jgi:glutamyl-tRNA reductase
VAPENPGRLALVGSSHHVAPVRVRDALFPNPERRGAFFEAVRNGELLVDGAVVLSTCSRAELYVVAPNVAKAAERVQQWFLDGALNLKGHTYVKTKEAAVLHLHSVAAGLDSIMLGEHEILGQLKDSLEEATEQGTVGPVMERLFRSALKAGRRARQETAIGRGGTSLPYAASKIAADVVPQGERGTVVIVGAGRTARLAAHHFHKAGWAEIVIVNRTLSRAQDLAGEYGGRAAELDDLAEALEGADTLVAAVSSDSPVVLANVLASATEGLERPLVALDLGNPRNIDPDARELWRVHLRDLDDLRDVSEASRSNRTLEVPAVAEIVEYEAGRFNAWLAHRSVIPLVKRLRESFTEIADAELSKHARHFQEEDRVALERFTQSLLNKLLHHPTALLKEMAEAAPAQVDRISAVQEIFVAAGWGEPASDESDP